MRPRIALTTYADYAEWRDWSRPAAVLPRSYVDVVERAGGCPVLLPPGRPTIATDALRGADGLILTGGPDLDARLGPNGSSDDDGPVLPERDRWEAALLEVALKADMPTLGICRGMQLMNLYLGGRLHTHLPDFVGHDGHQVAPGVFGTHEVRLAEGSLTAAAMGLRAQVPSYHHQGVALLGHDVDPVGWADDGIIEAIELRGHSFAVGVQWHPEENDDLALFRMLVDFSTSRPVSA